ncbi:MAG: riboflavin synthase [Gaiellaceae bacterium]
MFTGIVRERGSVIAAELLDDTRELRLCIQAPATAAITGTGDSVAVAGCCLTVTAVDDGTLRFEAVPETIERTTLGRLREDDGVNIEPALRVGDPLGGHFVQGHVDGRGHVRSLVGDGEGARLWLDLEPDLLRYCVEKGSIALDGVSLTIATLDEGGLAVALIPYTLRETTLGGLAPGDEVNVEVDLLAKYAERLVRR